MKQIDSGILKKNVTRSVNLFLHPLKFLCLFLVLAFSIDGFACDDVTGTVSAPSNPDDPASNYAAGRIMYCAGEEEKGLGYIERASDMNHVTASYFLGEYYRKDKDINSSTNLPTTQENYDAAIFYYERAAGDIENTTSYPKRPDGRGIYGTEEEHYMSVRVFLHLNRLYYNGYSRALGDMLKNDVSYTDTIQVLENMKSAADRCLKRPSLSIWGARQNEITDSKQVICQARKDFAEKTHDLELQRIEIAKYCEVSLKECDAHKTVFSQIAQAAREMVREMKTVPAI